MKKSPLKIILIVVFGLVFCGLIGFGGIKYYSYSQSKPYNYYPGTDFITDISSSDKLVKIDLVIELENGRYKRFLNKNCHKVKDLILFIIRNKDEQTMKSKEIKQILTNEIIEALKNELGVDNAKMVYFNEFVME